MKNPFENMAFPLDVVIAMKDRLSEVRAEIDRCLSDLFNNFTTYQRLRQEEACLIENLYSK